LRVVNPTSISQRQSPLARKTPVSSDNGVAAATGFVPVARRFLDLERFHGGLCRRGAASSAVPIVKARRGSS
jgi:hypothetical protein